jgi:hypothetical protein
MSNFLFPLFLRCGLMRGTDATHFFALSIMCFYRNKDRYFGASVLYTLYTPDGHQRALRERLDHLLANKPELDRNSSYYRIMKLAQRNPYERTQLTAQGSKGPVR